LKMERKKEEARETREEFEASTELSAETKAALCVLIKELDEILRSPKLTDRQKVVSIEALQSAAKKASPFKAGMN